MANTVDWMGIGDKFVSYLVAIVGPESTGKTTLATQLAIMHHGVWLPEYARTFLSDAHYTEDEIHIVAREQLSREQDFVRANPHFGVLDTDGVVLRVWFAERFGHVPTYIDRHLEQQATRTYLLMYPDLPWEFDPQRESKADLSRLFEVYEQVLSEQAFEYAVIKGKGDARMRGAIDYLQTTGVVS